MGVILQAFYWDCPKAEKLEHQWWAYIKSKLPSIAQSAHALGLEVYADLVFNHNSGADAQELNPIDGQWR